MSQRERDGLKVLHEGRKEQLSQKHAAVQLGLTDRGVRKLLGRLRKEGDRGIGHRLRGRSSNRHLPEELRQRAVARVRESYRDFGPTLAMEYWAKRDKNRINFVRIPLSMRPGFEDQETLYHTLEEIGEAERLHIKVFEAIHVDHQPLKTLTEMADFLEWYGIPSQRFLEVARSPAVKARRAAAEAMLAHYKIKSVPVLVVDGRFITSATRIGGTHAESVIVTEWLLKRAEAEQRAATKTK